MESLNRILIPVTVHVFLLALSTASVQAADNCFDTNTGEYKYCEDDCCSTGDDAPCCTVFNGMALIIGCIVGGVFLLCCAGIITVVIVFKLCKSLNPGTRQGAVVNPIQTPTVAGSVRPNHNGTRAFSSSYSTNFPNATYQPHQLGGQNNQHGDQNHRFGGHSQYDSYSSQFSGQPPNSIDHPPPAYSTIASAPPFNPNEINGLSEHYPPPFYATKGQ